MTKEFGTNDLLDTWAAGGTKITPDVSKVDAGWQNGERPAYQFMNWIQNAIFKQLNYLMRNGIPAWNSETNYVVGSVVVDGGVPYIAGADNLNNQPPSADWNQLQDDDLANYDNSNAQFAKLNAANVFTVSNQFDGIAVFGAGQTKFTDNNFSNIVEAGDVNSFWRLDFPDLDTSEGGLHLFRSTDSSGLLGQYHYRGNGGSAIDHLRFSGNSGRVIDDARNGGDVHLGRLSENARFFLNGNDMRPTGADQTLTNVLATRAGNTIYTNTTGRTIFVIVSAFSSGSNPVIEVDGEIVAQSASNRVPFTIPVKDGSTYEVTRTGGGSPTIDEWWELR